jgi:hypothetical protein
LQQAGGIIALIHAATLVTGMVLGFTLMYPLLEATPDQALRFLADNQPLVYLWKTIVYWVSAITLALMLPALYQRLKAGPRILLLAAFFSGAAGRD